MIDITIQDLEIGSFFFKNMDKYTLSEIAIEFKVSNRIAGLAITKYMQFRKMRHSLVDWDPHELEGELNPDHDFRRLIKYNG